MADTTKRISTDSAVATLTTVEGEPARQAYRVTAKAGVFKNGKQYKQGADVQLDSQTAANFLATGDVEEK